MKSLSEPSSRRFCSRLVEYWPDPPAMNLSRRVRQILPSLISTRLCWNCRIFLCLRVKSKSKPVVFRPELKNWQAAVRDGWCWSPSPIRSCSATLDPQIFKDLRFTKSGIFLRIASSRPSKRASFFLPHTYLNFNQKAYLVAVGIYEYHARFSAMTGAWSVVIHCPWWYYLRKQTARLGREVNIFWNRPI